MLPETPALRRSAVDTVAPAAAPYRALRSAAPRYWTPVLLDETTGTFLGASTGGSDLIGRHAWSGWAALATSTGRAAGAALYEYRGLPPVPGMSLQPSVAVAAGRAWDRITEPEQPGDPYIDEREDVLSARTALLHRRFRSITSVSFGGELVLRRRQLLDGGDLRLRDPADDLLGVRVTTLFSNARSYPFSISAEDGITLQLAARERWERTPRAAITEDGDTLRFDASEREFTAWSAAYLSLGRVAFANSVLALRASALLRDGPGASTHGVGGSSGSAFIYGLDLGSQFLPVRGFPAGTRRGTRAWSATAEVRLPIRLLTMEPSPLPMFLDRLSVALFADAGDAACAAAEACDPRRLGDTLLSAGAEVRLDASIIGLTTLFRLGAASPISGSRSHRPRWYLQLGSAF
jgi:hypothetical protein